MIFNSLCKINLGFIRINFLNYVLESFLYVKSIVAQLTFF